MTDGSFHMSRYTRALLYSIRKFVVLTMSTLISALQQLEVHPGLHHLLNLDTLNQYSRLVVHMKVDILLPQPLDESHPDMPPKILSPSIVQFLAGALSLTPTDVQTSWDILRTYLWRCQAVPLIPEDFDAAMMHSSASGGSLASVGL